ncbi:hypothetical protein AGMMS49965_04160 [Bacteroidia bacterium]|nr:hypothetical protein AGMMS49965_04160 [Bacteroidia bacterium]
MQQNFEDDLKQLCVLFPTTLDVEAIKQQRAMEPFAEEAIDFLNALSQALTKDVRTRAYPDVATFAFFCRKANILHIKGKYAFDEEYRLGRGIVFHIAPSNVPVNFAYSLLCGILAGNVNIVRVSIKEFEQVAIISDAIAQIHQTGNYDSITQRIFLVRYNRQSTATSLFSSLCDVRVIWGGDETIATIRKSPLPARSFDITFADRYSLCVINADVYCRDANPETVASGFYNDTYLFDQNACTAPHLLAWIGESGNVEHAKTIFWDALYQVVKQKYSEVQPVIAVDKLTALYTQAIELDDVRKIASEDNLLWRVNIHSLPANIDEFRCSCGYFSEIHIQSLSDLSAIINRKYQTLAYYGFSKEELSDFVKANHPFGIDRIVPIGQTTEFSLNWDGYNLVEILSREIIIKL